MNLEFMIFALTGYSLQIVFLVSLALMAAFLCRIKNPITALWYWQGIFGLALVLPVIEILPSPSSLVIEPFLGLEVDAVVFPTPSINGDVPWQLLLLCILTVGAVINLGRLCLGLIRIKAILRNSIPFDPLPAPISMMQEKLNKRCDFRISSDISMPLTFGMWNPIVLVKQIDLNREKLVDSRVVGITLKD